MWHLNDSDNPQYLLQHLSICLTKIKRLQGYETYGVDTQIHTLVITNYKCEQRALKGKLTKQ